MVTDRTVPTPTRGSRTYGFLVVWQRDGEPLAQPVAALAADFGGPTDPPADLRASGGAVAVVAPGQTGTDAVDRASDGGDWALADGRLDTPARLAARLDLDPVPSPAALVLAGYRRWGADVARHLEGSFAFAVWDDRERRLVLGRDRLGVRGLAWWHDRRHVVVASDPALLVRLTNTHSAIDDGRVTAFLVDGWHHEETSFFRSLRYVPPATTVCFTTRGETRDRFWQPALDTRLETGAAIEAFTARSTEAVRHHLPTNGPVALSLSGGLDSSWVAHLAADALGEARDRLTAYGYVFDRHPACDERRFAEPLCTRLGVTHRTVSGDGLWALRDVASWPVDPAFVVADPYARLSLSIADAAARDEHRFLLTGHFGDMLHVGAGGWRSELLATRRIGPWLRAAWHGSPLDAMRAVRSDVLRLLPPRLASTLRTWSAWRRPRLGRVLGPALGVYTDALRGLPEPARDCPTFGHWLRWHTLFHPSTAQGAMSARGFYHRRGIERRDPFWEPSLVELALSAPAAALGTADVPRRMISEALANAGHHAIAARRDKASFHPLLHEGIQRERATVDALIRTPRIVERGWIRHDWLLRGRDPSTWQDGGYLFWKCLSLELWLRHLES